MMKQLLLFEPNRLRYHLLSAPDSKRRAYYEICLESSCGEYIVRKESGIQSRMLDQREWRFTRLEAAERFYARKVTEKTNPNRRSVRKYKVTRCDE